MIEITVRVGGIINNTLDDEEFVEIASQLFGTGKTLEEYIKLYNESGPAKSSNTVVHKSVSQPAITKEVEVKPTVNDYLNAATNHINEVAGYSATIVFAEDDCND